MILTIYGINIRSNGVGVIWFLDRSFLLIRFRLWGATLTFSWDSVFHGWVFPILTMGDFIVCPIRLGLVAWCECREKVEQHHYTRPTTDRQTDRQEQKFCEDRAWLQKKKVIDAALLHWRLP